MTVHKVGLMVGIQIDEVGWLGVVAQACLVHCDPLLFELLHLAHVHVVNALLRYLRVVPVRVTLLVVRATHHFVGVLNLSLSGFWILIADCIQICV